MVKPGAVWVVIIVLFVALFALWAHYNVSKKEANPYPDKYIHWHTNVSFILCGVKQGIPRHDGTMIGPEVLHTHNDDIIHIEAQVRDPNEVKFGRFMDIVGVSFDKGRVFNYTDSKDGCGDGGNHTVKMYINGVETDLFRDYLPRDKDQVLITY